MDEVWDDSALVESWNEALEEYKKYHSIAARGEKLTFEQIKEATASLEANGKLEHSNRSNNKTIAVDETTMPSKSGGLPDKSTQVPPATSAQSSNGTNVVQNILGSAQNEGMKNLMMSWYYAGYYTGLYEGQQKAWAEMQADT